MVRGAKPGQPGCWGLDTRNGLHPWPLLCESAVPRRSLLNNCSQIHGDWTGRNFSWRSPIFSHFLADFSTSRTETERNRGSLTCSLILQMSTYTWPRRKKCLQRESHRQRIYFGRLAFPGKGDALSLPPKLCIHVWVSVCVCVCVGSG